MSRKLSVAAVLAVLFTAACTSHPAATPPPPSPTPSVEKTQATTALPAAATTVVPGTSAAELALAASKALFTSAPAVVLAAIDDAAAITKGATTATNLGVPLLLSPKLAAVPSPAPSVSPSPWAAAAAADPLLQTEIGRLDPQTVVTVGDGAAAYERLSPGMHTVALTSGTGDDSVLPSVRPAAPLSDLLVLALTGDASTAAIATAKAAGAKVIVLGGPDPRATSASVKAMSGQKAGHVLALGTAFGSADILRGRIDTAVTGVELPGGGQIVFPGRHMVALYGHPGSASLGSVGQRDLHNS